MSQTPTPFLFIRETSPEGSRGVSKKIRTPVLREKNEVVAGQLFIAPLPTQAWLALESILRTADEKTMRGLAEVFLSIQKQTLTAALGTCPTQTTVDPRPGDPDDPERLAAEGRPLRR